MWRWPKNNRKVFFTCVALSGQNSRTSVNSTKDWHQWVAPRGLPTKCGTKTRGGTNSRVAALRPEVRESCCGRLLLPSLLMPATPLDVMVDPRAYLKFVEVSAKPVKTNRKNTLRGLFL